MALRRKSREVGEVSMSSMADIIFMLLIFFMLSSTLKKMIDYDLAKSSSRSMAPNKVNVEIRKDGHIELNDSKISPEGLRSAIQQAVRGKSKPNEVVTLSIYAEKGCPFGALLPIMKIADELKCKTIMGTEPDN